VTLIAALAIAAAAALPGGGAKERPITFSLRGDVATILDPSNLRALVALERQIGALPGVRAVTGPGKFVERSINATNRTIRQQLATSRPQRAGAARRRLADLLVRYGYEGMPSLDNESFIGQLIFGSSTRPRPGLAWLLPDRDHALVLVRPRPGLGGAGALKLGRQIRRLVDAAPLGGIAAHATTTT
jgi:hypothetical protein